MDAGDAMSVANPPRVIAVIGMGRAGSSLLARVLNLLGMDLGNPDRIMGPANSNPKGHWEYVPFVEINDAILAAFGGSWDEPPSFPRDWQKAPRLDELKERARSIIREDFSNSRLWGWKDPRASITLPFWQELIPLMQYIICLRDPLAVARSLQVRDGYSLEKGGRLWLTYVSSSIVNSIGAPRRFVYYEDLVEEWPVHVKRLASFLGLEGNNIPAETMKAIGEFIQTELQHHNKWLPDTLSSDMIPYGVQALHLVLRVLTKAGFHAEMEDKAATEGLASALNAFALRTMSVQMASEEESARDEELSRDLALALQETSDARSELRSLEETIEQLKTHAQGMEGSLSWQITRPLRRLKGIVLALLRHL
jgi:hypothetical protein